MSELCVPDVWAAPALLSLFVSFGRIYLDSSGIHSYCSHSALIKEQPWKENLLIYLLLTLWLQFLIVASGLFWYQHPRDRTAWVR